MFKIGRAYFLLISWHQKSKNIGRFSYHSHTILIPFSYHSHTIPGGPKSCASPGALPPAGRNPEFWHFLGIKKVTFLELLNLRLNVHFFGSNKKRRAPKFHIESRSNHILILNMGPFSLKRLITHFPHLPRGGPWFTSAGREHPKSPTPHSGSRPQEKISP